MHFCDPFFRLVKVDYISTKDSKTLLKIYVQPGASKNEICGLYGEPARLKIKVKAPPSDGEANAEVIVFVAKTLGVSKSRVELIKGHTSRQKDLAVDLLEADVRGKLLF